ncbi:MAG: hypothetical protein LC637_07040 [Xanthomonadaceae bacterium]|nr:hypothetical protein [Xanthomonadaceae bacterium]
MKPPTLHLARAAVLLAALIALSGCGSGAREIRGELPLIRFEGLIVEASEVRLAIGLRNVNDRSLALRRLKAVLKVEDELLLETETRPQIEISARGREVVTLRGSGQREGLRLLTQRFAPTPGSELPANAGNAAWTMELILTDERERESAANASGFLHPVPGRPGHFR